MTAGSSEFWARVYLARDKLAEQFLSHPAVTLIDLSYELDKGKSTEHVVLRVHVRQPVDKHALGLPDEVEGIPVRLVTGDYQLE